MTRMSELTAAASAAVDVADISVAGRLAEIGATFTAAARSAYPAAIEAAADLIGDCYAHGRKLLVFGNGGSASDAQHLCGELVVRFQKNRRALPALSLCSDAAVMTACSNDFSYVDVFARQVEALGLEGDVALGISTSGTSPNVIKGLQTACDLGLTTILLTGSKVDPESTPFDLVVAAPGKNTARVQELHLAAYHVICELIEERFFGGLLS